MADKIDFINDMLRKGSSVINVPYRYKSSADPGGRVFVRHMMMDAPLVSLRPGRATFRGGGELRENFKKILGLESDAEVNDLIAGGVSAVEGVYNSQRRFGAGSDSTHYESIREEIKRKEFGAPTPNQILREGIRYVEFEEAVGEYISTVLTLASRVHASMSQVSSELAFTPSSAADQARMNERGGFFTFWAENSTSVSESVNSEYGASFIEEMMNRGSGIAKEGEFFLGLSGESGLGEAIVDNVAGFFDGGDNRAIIREIGAGIRGYKPSFPQMWKNSSFARSYNLSFKFFSPYGSPEAIFRNVYMPFIMLLAMSLPMTRSPGSFSEPFIFQVDAPGFFACDLGICTSLTFTKGGSEGLWTADGLPRVIEVTMAIDDLYPALTASHNVGSLKTNIGLMTFLDNLSGINLSISGERQTVYGALKERMNQVSNTGTPAVQSAKAYLQDFYYDFSITRSLSNLFDGSDATAG